MLANKHLLAVIIRTHPLHMPSDQTSRPYRIQSQNELSNFGGKICNALIKEDRKRDLILPATPLSGRLSERKHMHVLFSARIYRTIK
jgi:hypothetical protein